MEPIPLTAPYSGQADLYPVVALRNPYCQRITNFNLDDGNAYLRNGDSVFASKSGGLALSLDSYGAESNEKLFLTYAVSSIPRVAQVTAGSISDVYTPGGIGGDDEIMSLFFNNTITYFGETSWRPGVTGNPQYNGSAWGLAGYTYSTILPFGGCAYKERAYHLGRFSTKYAYTGIGAITGACTEVDLATVLRFSGYLYAIAPVSLSEGINQELDLAFIFSSGEVLVYSGSNPAAANWTLVGRFMIPPPVYFNAVVEANGDVFVISKSGLISLRSLFTEGKSVATHKGLSSVMPKRWKQIFQSTVSFIGMKGIFDQANERIVISLQNYVNEDGTIDDQDGHRIIYSFKTNSWTEHRVKLNDDVAFLSSSAYFQNNVYSAVSALTHTGVTKMEGASDFQDAQVDGGSAISYEYEIVSAPILDRHQYVQKATGIDTIIESDLYAETKYQFIADTGVQSSEEQAAPDMGTGLQKAHANVGLEGNYVQYRIAGTTAASKTIGYKLYAANVWAEYGSSPR